MTSIDELCPQTENDTSEKVTLADVATVGQQIADAIKTRLAGTDTDADADAAADTNSDADADAD